MAGEWRPCYISDTASCDSTKDFVMPAEFQLLSIRVLLTTTATAGNRLMHVQIFDDSDATNKIGEVRSGVVQIASTDWNYMFWPGAPRLTAVYDSDLVMIPTPSWILQKGQMIRVLDGAAVAADSDSMEVFITGMQKGSMWGMSSYSELDERAK